MRNFKEILIVSMCGLALLAVAVAPSLLLGGCATSRATPELTKKIVIQDSIVIIKDFNVDVVKGDDNLAAKAKAKAKAEGDPTLDITGKLK